jgi:hypothetical protein
VLRRCQRWLAQAALRHLYALCKLLGAHRLAHDVVRAARQSHAPDVVVLMPGQHEDGTPTLFGQVRDQPAGGHVGQVRG